MPVNLVAPDPASLRPVAGVRLGIAAAGIKKPGRRDITLIELAPGSRVAGVFTQNRFCAAPVTLCRQHLSAGAIRALVINTGNANAGTGEEGLARARRTCEAVAGLFGVKAENVLPFSTGVILEPLPVDKILPALPAAKDDLAADHWSEAAHAIMTTDIVAKGASRQIRLGGKTVTVTGIAKGSGMIHPNMATMLGFVTTDADLDPAALQQALKEATEQSFNMITVDGDTSTNDMVIAMANGLAHSPKITLESPLYATFAAALRQVLTYLAKAIARDGEGATKLIEVRVRGAASVEDARKAARSVCGSSLVKAAVFGEDANWGRVLAALGYSGASFDPNRVDLWLGDVQMMAAGAGLAFDEGAAARVLKEKSVCFTADLHSGSAEATAWGCDLTYDYVKINGSYRT